MCAAVNTQLRDGLGNTLPADANQKPLNLQTDRGNSATSDEIVAAALASPPPRQPSDLGADANTADAMSAGNNLRTRSEIARRRSYSPYSPGGLFPSARRADPSPQVDLYRHSWIGVEAVSDLRSRVSILDLP